MGPGDHSACPSVPSEDALDGYYEGLREHAAERRARNEERIRALRGRLPALVAHLVRQYGVRRVVLFGSLARGRADERSDVDLLVTGLSTRSLLRASSEAEHLLEDARVDLVPSELARACIRERAEAEGEVLYEQRDG